MRHSVIIYLLAATAVITGCQKKTTTPQNGGQGNTDGATVYVAGAVGATATYWKNGKAVTLSSSEATAKAMAVSGNDIYVAGTTTTADGEHAAYWKNGQQFVLDAGDANSIAVSGNDVYIVGTVNVQNVSYACYWKNGQLVKLSNNTSYADAITISGSDVYMAGDVAIGAYTYAACYWKNGNLVKLTNGSAYERATGIAISGSNVYVSGFVINGDLTSNTIATYWENGQQIVLSSAGWANAAYISADGDVYILGNGLEYWKNGTSVTIGGNYKSAGSSALAVSGSDVYVAGYILGSSVNTDAGYWKNGKWIDLTNGNGNAEAGAIVVVQ